MRGACWTKALLAWSQIAIAVQWLNLGRNGRLEACWKERAELEVMRWITQVLYETTHRAGSYFITGNHQFFGCNVTRDPLTMSEATQSISFISFWSLASVCRGKNNMRMTRTIRLHVLRWDMRINCLTSLEGQLCSEKPQLHTVKTMWEAKPAFAKVKSYRLLTSSKLSWWSWTDHENLYADADATIVSKDRKERYIDMYILQLLRHSKCSTCNFTRTCDALTGESNAPIVTQISEEDGART